MLGQAWRLRWGPPGGHGAGQSYGQLLLTAFYRILQGHLPSAIMRLLRRGSVVIGIRTPRRPLLLLPTMLVCVVGGADAQLFVNGDFEEDAASVSGGFTPMAPTGWSAGGDTIVAESANGAWGGLAAPSAGYYLILQNGGSFVAQAISGLVPGGLYTLSFHMSCRPNDSLGDQSAKVSADGVDIWSSPNPLPSVFTPYVVYFQASSQGTVAVAVLNNSPSGDRTVLLDDVQLDLVSPGPFANGDFEVDAASVSGGFTPMAPTGWSAGGDTIVAESANGAWGGLAAPSAGYYLILQNGGSFVAQAISGLVPGGLYTLSFHMSCRPNDSLGDQSAKVSADGVDIWSSPNPLPSVFTPYVVYFQASSQGTVAVAVLNNSPSGDRTVLLDGVQLDLVLGPEAEALANASAAVGPACVAGSACSPFQVGVGPNGVAMVAPDLVAAIMLNADISSIGANGSPTYVAFVDAFEADVATALGIGIDQVEVTSLAAGSISAHFRVKPSSTGVPVSPSLLASTFSSSGVSLGGVFSSSTLALEDIAQQAAACNSPDVLDTIVECTNFLLTNVAEIALGLTPENNTYCNSTCAQSLEPTWLMCNTGNFMSVPMRSPLEAPAQMLGTSCGMSIVSTDSSSDPGAAATAAATAAASEGADAIYALIAGSLLGLAVVAAAAILGVKYMRRKIPGWMPFSKKVPKSDSDFDDPETFDSEDTSSG